MGELNITEKITSIMKKYRIPILILLSGILLMTIPGIKQAEMPQQTETKQVETHDVSAQLNQILSCIQGAGKVELYLSIAEGERINYLQDEDISTDPSSSDIHRDTVIITGANKTQSGIVTQVTPPKYLGAVVVCQGADSAAVRLAMVDAVSKATGLGSDKITVLKMK